MKPLLRPEKLLERSLHRGENMVENNNQTNALYVVDSAGKLNLVDGPNRKLSTALEHCIHFVTTRPIPVEQQCGS